MLPFIVLTAAVCAAAVSDLSTSDTRLDPPTLTTGQRVSLPKSFKWNSSGPLIGPKGRNLAALKDPSIVEINGTYHVFASTAQSSGYNMMYLNFTDFDQANSSTYHYLDETPIGPGYRAAPQVFYFAPQSLWYLIFQNGNAAYSTNKDIGNPAGWSVPTNFYGDIPAIISQNLAGGYWIDMWVICDSSDCYLFSSDDNGRLYRSQTTLDNFPNGMGNTAIALSDSNKFNLFEAACVYKIAGGDYLLIVEAIGGNGDRWFRSWTSPSINGSWADQANTEDNPFARSNNVVFSGTPWTTSISHGEIVRNRTDQTLTIDPCNLRFLYQGVGSTVTDDYNSLPWRIGLLTQTNSAC